MAHVDRRVRRSRAALTRAAVTLVTERGTAAIPISELAAAADVSRQLVYQHFGDRDALLLEAALDLVRTDLLPQLAETGPDDGTDEGRAPALAVATHFAGHRAFYRAMFTSSTAPALNDALSALLVPLNRQAMAVYFAAADPRQLDDLAVFMTGGAAAVVNAWVTGADDPLDPEDLADRLVGLVGVLAGVSGQTKTHNKETGR